MATLPELSLTLTSVLQITGGVLVGVFIKDALTYYVKRGLEEVELAKAIAADVLSRLAALEAQILLLEAAQEAAPEDRSAWDKRVQTFALQPMRVDPSTSSRIRGGPRMHRLLYLLADRYFSFEFWSQELRELAESMRDCHKPDAGADRETDIGRIYQDYRETLALMLNNTRDAAALGHHLLIALLGHVQSKWMYHTDHFKRGAIEQFMSTQYGIEPADLSVRAAFYDTQGTKGCAVKDVRLMRLRTTEKGTLVTLRLALSEPHRSFSDSITIETGERFVVPANAEFPEAKIALDGESRGAVRIRPTHDPEGEVLSVK